MSRVSFGWLLPAALAAALTAAHAQSPRPAATAPDPLDARADVPPLVHRSVLSADRRVDDTEPLPWLEANRNVQRIGGWRAYAREAAAAQAQAEAQAKPAAPGQAEPKPAPPAQTPSMPHGHGGHKMH